jgi:antitoxin (DNA-binding transcriptional repressor) of toxin-antitoxin stability system
MQTTFSGIIVSGEVQLDRPVELADRSRVHVTIVPVDQSRTRWAQSLDALDHLKAANPIRSGGQRNTRDELHERR